MWEEKYGGTMEEVRTRVPGVGTYPGVINNIINTNTVTIIILTVILLWITGGNSSVPGYLGSVFIPYLRVLFSNEHLGPSIWEPHFSISGKAPEIR